MISHYPAYLIVAPLLAAFFISIAGWFRRDIAFSLGTASLGISLVSSVLLLMEVMATSEVRYVLGGWTAPFGIEYYVDPLNGIILVVISAIAFFNMIGTRPIIRQTYGDKVPAFYALYLLSVAGHLGIVITGDAFNLYVLLEISALAGYALLAMGSDKAPLATLRYLFMGTVGASFYLLGVGYLYIMTGSLNMLDLASILPNLSGSFPIIAAFGLILVGVWVKMAFFPLHTWLPNAYSYAASPAASLIAPLTTKVMVYVMIRMMLTVFGPEMTFSIQILNELIVWMAVAAIVVCAFLALAQRDLKKMLTYILIAEVGYMVGGAWLGNATAMTGAILHIVNDALMTFCVFLAATALGSRLPNLEFDNLKGLFRKMPITMAVFLIGALSMIGVPPTCGFFSKWYLILGAIEAGQLWFVAALIFSSLVNIVLFFRIFEIAYFEPFHDEAQGSHDTHAVAVSEAHWNVLMVLVLAAISLVAVGLYTGEIINAVIRYAIPQVML